MKMSTEMLQRNPRVRITLRPRSAAEEERLREALKRRWEGDHDFCAWMASTLIWLERHVGGDGPPLDGRVAGRLVIDQARAAGGRYPIALRRGVSAMLGAASVDLGLGVQVTHVLRDVYAGRADEATHQIAVREARLAFSAEPAPVGPTLWLAVSAVTAPWDLGVTAMLAVHWADLAVRSSRGIPAALGSRGVPEHEDPNWLAVVAIDAWFAGLIQNHSSEGGAA